MEYDDEQLRDQLSKMSVKKTPTMDTIKPGRIGSLNGGYSAGEL